MALCLHRFLRPKRGIAAAWFIHEAAAVRADSSAQRALQSLEASEKVELGPDGWQVTDPLFALWLATTRQPV